MAAKRQWLEPPLVAGEGRGQQPMFAPLMDFVYGTEERPSTPDQGD